MTTIKSRLLPIDLALSWASFALLALSALAPLCQAQTNHPSGKVVMWGGGDVPVSAQSGVVAITAGGEHVMALKSDGTLVAWGKNRDGQVNGIPTTASPYSAVAAPVTIGGQVLSNVAAIAAGSDHSVALKNDGSVVAWGANSLGQTAVPVAAHSGVTAIAAGDYFTLAVKTNGTVVAWGDNLRGQVNGIPVTGPPRSAVAAPVTLGGQTLSGVTAVAADGMHTLALRTNGSVVAWGWNYYGQTSVPVAAMSGVVAIAAGHSSGSGYSMALKNDGSVVAWGYNGPGLTDVPVEAQSGVVAIAAGLSPVALKSDGSVVRWGLYVVTLTNLPPVLAIADGQNFTVALVQEPPLVNLLRNPDQTLSLSWSGAGLLEQTESLATPNWQPALNQANPQTLNPTNLMQFYRVKAD